MKGAFAVLKDGLSKLNFILSKQQKIYGIIVLAMSMVGAVLETVGVGVVIPLVQMFLNVDMLMDSAVIGKILQCFHISSDSELIILTMIFIMAVFLIKNIYFMLLSWVRVKYSSKIERELSVNMLSACVKRGYTYFLNENNAEIMKYISVDAVGANQLVYHFLRVITDICIILFVGIYLMITDYMIAIGVMVMAGLCILIVYGYFRKKCRLRARNIISTVEKPVSIYCNLSWELKRSLFLKNKNIFLINMTMPIHSVKINTYSRRLDGSGRRI